MSDFTTVISLSYHSVSNITDIGGSGNVNFVYSSTITWFVTQPKRYIQRVYDDTLGIFCYFDDRLVLPNPSSSQTTPNHANNLKSGSHEIVSTYFQENNIDYNFLSNNKIYFSAPVSAVLPSQRYLQRIYDTNLQRHCYYISYDINPTPISSSTNPNHTNNIQSGSHEVVQVLRWYIQFFPTTIVNIDSWLSF